MIIYFCVIRINPLNANPTKWFNTLKQFVGYRLTADELLECV